MTVLGKLTVDPVGEALGTGFGRFVSPLGVDGLVKVRSPRLDILFVGTSQPGTGQFRRFIAQAKTEFDIICIWEIWNDQLKTVLPRYGFLPATDFQDGEQLTGFRWDRVKC
jgi:hypothetical protein